MKIDRPIRHLLLTITGASGSVYGLHLCRELLGQGIRVTLTVTAAGLGVLRHETGLDWRGTEEEIRRSAREYFGGSDQLDCFDEGNLFAPPASGSSAPDAMVISPCSMGTLARVACGISTNLPERCADVMLKERRPLLLVPRETPLNDIHLENMLRLSRMGAVVVPAMPGFYHRPQKVEELVAFMTGKVLDLLGLEHSLYTPWGAPGNGE